jgi:hypothetical protein
MLALALGAWASCTPAHVCQDGSEDSACDQAGAQSDADTIALCGTVGRGLGWCHSDVCAAFREPADHATLVGKLTSLSGIEEKNLFYCDLPNMAAKVAPERYADLMQTAPIAIDWSDYAAFGVVHVTEDFWDVRWALGFDAHAIYGLLAAILPSSSTLDFVELLAFVKKEFPTQDQRPLRGWTSFPYDAGHANINPTQNTIREHRLSDPNVQNLPTLMMSYSEPPWYSQATGTGFVDLFRFLTPDLIIAKGSYGLYDAQNPDPDPARLVTPSVQQFWMERKHLSREVALSAETSLLSVPILDAMWNGGAAPSAATLDGRWDADLIMNETIVRNEASLSVSGADATFTTTIAGGAAILPALELGARADGRTAVLTPIAGPALALRQVASGVDVLVGERCLPVQDLDAARDLGAWVDFLPWATREIFLAQFVRPGPNGSEYCVHYLLRRSP